MIVLTLKLAQDVYVGCEQVVVKEILASNYAVLTHRGKEYEVDPEIWVPLWDGCQVRLGKPRDEWSERSRREVRLQFEAPGQLILRGTSYRNEKKEP